MTFSVSQDEKHNLNASNTEIIEHNMVQTLQDAFCVANQIYCVCMNREQGTITKAYGSQEELDYLKSVVGTDIYTQIVVRLSEQSIEEVIEEQPYSDVKICGVSIQVHEHAKAVWIVVAFIRDEQERELEVPSYMMTTTKEQFYKSIKLLEVLSKQIFTARLDEIQAQEAYFKSRKSEEQMEAELKRNEVMTNIVHKLESEEEFVVIVKQVLQEVCGYTNLTDAMLLQLNKNQVHVDIICEYNMEGRLVFQEHMSSVPTKHWPFFTGKPYTISSNVTLPKNFLTLFREYGIKAAVYLPIEISGQPMMYMVFSELNRERVFSLQEIKFLNDAKRIVSSILTKRITQNSLASSYTSLDAILENVGCGIYVCDETGEKALYTNQCYRDFFNKESQRRTLESLLGGQTEHMVPFTEFYSDEDNRWFDVHSSNIHWVDGREVRLYTLYEVTDKKIYQQKIEKQANNDFLTGLYNRMRFEQDLEECIRRTKDCGGCGALLYIDLDDFKHINDGLGHQYGDVLLREISKSLRKITGIESSCYRMGGDEFIVIVEHHYYNLLKTILDEISSIFTKPWFLKGAEYYCTMSMGVVRFPTDGESVEELIRNVDTALFEAKKTGKNRIEYYDEGVVQSISFKRLDLEKNMRNATSNACSEFEVYYQPIMGKNHICQGAEALIRWNSQEMGFISPNEFIPLAEYLGLINPIGNYVLEEACRRCKYWNDMGHPSYQINVNLSVVQLLQKDIVSKIKSVVEDTGILPENLVLEVTESLAVNDMSRMKGILEEVKQLGVKVAMDDFGTGYSSLNHVREMPLDIIKIDRCFIMDIGKDEFSESFVKMVAELAGTIGVKICVEGVENKEQYERIAEMKIEQIQGYYYDKPMTGARFEEKYL